MSCISGFGYAQPARSLSVAEGSYSMMQPDSHVTYFSHQNGFGRRTTEQKATGNTGMTAVRKEQGEKSLLHPKYRIAGEAASHKNRQMQLLYTIIIT